MQIESITLKGFQSAGDIPVVVNLAKDLTAFVGGNGAGKTAVLAALQRMFGTSSKQRRIRKTDFHIPPGKTLDDYELLDLWVEVKVVFPELEEDEEGAAVPTCFRQMLVLEPGGAPYCRIRLKATWEDDATTDGAIEEQLWWMPAIEGEEPTRVTAPERGLIQIHYIPATRNESELLSQQTRLMKKRLFKAIKWTDDFGRALAKSAETIEETLNKEVAVATTNKLLKRKWKELSGAKLLANPVLSVISSDIKDVSNRITITLSPSEDGGVRSIDELSDGHTSLFYFALTAAVFEIEREVAKACTLQEDTGFCEELLRTPALTFFAIEEPENHLSPYYLCRVLNAVKNISEYDVSQTIVTSHSSSILGRVSPDSVRHFRLAQETRTTLVNPILFPEEDVEAAKFMRNAVLAFPELYFAKCVVLCEGDSEQVVIPQVAGALNVDLDPSFVAVVPLGGRHVNHFWRLLHNLGIPYVTLLDLDLGRDTGGWSRLSYLAKQLVENGVDQEFFRIQDGELAFVEKEDFAINVANIKSWVNHIRTKGVYCSWPLDLDMAMLNAFPEAYQTLPEGARGPRIDVEQAIPHVLKDGRTEAWYDGELADLKQYFPFYNYLFLGKSKPVSHIRAIGLLEDADIAQNCPEELKALIEAVKNIVEQPGE
ncbi:ATP-dependent nuclease [Pseudodesulfovibrio sp.]|uniref:ATP-dependent nuclease n=1 Tax=unclassified Pseudodesulfovibrio TaxID=2661612 RepID=UPI003AFFC67D